MMGQREERSARPRGQHAGLDRADVLAAALDLVDVHGLSALTMRRLGAELGVEAMALYHHVPSKEAVLDGLVELVVGAAVPATDSDWQGLLRGYARDLRRALQAHPEVVPLVITRPAVTPRTLDLLERGVAALDRAGFEPRQGLQMIHAMTGLVVGSVGTTDRADQVPGLPRAASLSEVDLADFPALRAAGAAPPGAAAGDLFDVVLEALVQGFAAQRGERVPLRGTSVGLDDG